MAALELPSLTIYKPGFLLNRRNDYRLGEKLGSYVPFMSKIESSDLGQAMIEHSISQIAKPEKILLLDNS